MAGRTIDKEGLPGNLGRRGLLAWQRCRGQAVFLGVSINWGLFCGCHYAENPRVSGLY